LLELKEYEIKVRRQEELKEEEKLNRQRKELEEQYKKETDSKKKRLHENNSKSSITGSNEKNRKFGSKEVKKRLNKVMEKELGVERQIIKEEIIETNYNTLIQQIKNKYPSKPEMLSGELLSTHDQMNQRHWKLSLQLMKMKVPQHIPTNLILIKNKGRSNGSG
jgi:hypothetical protein